MKSPRFMLGMELNFKVLILFFIFTVLVITGLTLFYPFTFISPKISRPQLDSEFLPHLMGIAWFGFHQPLDAVQLKVAH